MTLKDTKIGDVVTITKTGGTGPDRQHLLDMGVIPGNSLTVVKFAPLGDPIEVEISGYELTLRLSQAADIEVTYNDLKVENNKSIPNNKSFEKSIKSITIDTKDALNTHNLSHPGLGEEGIYHVQNAIPVIPKGEALSFALIGNQNTGKTTLFNTLTGASAHVGNFPGVTVSGTTGVLRDKKEISITDLPGIYSLSPYSPEEIITRNYLLRTHDASGATKPDGVINIVDATNIERNLYLTMQLAALNIPLVVALNMADIVIKNGGAIFINDLEKVLGVPVVSINAKTGEGVDELMRHIIHVARHHEGPLKNDYCDAAEDGGAVHRAIHAVMHLISDHAESSKIPIRFAAEKLLEGDVLVSKVLDLDANECDAIEHIAVQLEHERGLDRAAAIADMRFDFIKKVCTRCVKKPQNTSERKKSIAIDKVLTGKFTAIPCFILIIATVFFMTFCVLGPLGQNAIESLFEVIKSTLEHFLDLYKVPLVIKALLIDGVCNGVGSVVSFLPIIIVLFFFLSMLEDLGYMARIAFVMDKLLRKIGLSGRSIVPLILGFGCTVPAIMAARTLPSDRDRKLTILLTPFMSCSAKLPVYAYFCAAFFSPTKALIVMLCLYLAGIFIGVLFALIYQKVLFRGAAAPFMMELPDYRMPTARNIALLLWEKTKDFLSRAFTVILLATIVIWVLQTFSPSLAIVTDPAQSILAKLSGVISVIFTPLGFDDWRVTSSLITGFAAKETVVATMAVLFGSAQMLATIISPISALSLLVFCLLYTPCVASIAVIKREMGVKWAIFVAVWQCVVAWCAAAFVVVVAHFIVV